MKNKTKRRFVFIDESGEAGFPGLSGTFQVNILVVNSDALESLEREISLYKYFLTHSGELKKSTNIKNEKILNLLTKISEMEGVEFYYTKVDKTKYVGPHKKNPIRFRNLIFKKTLQNIDLIAKERNVNIEVVIDRYIDSVELEDDLKRFLKDGYGLPKFLHVEQVDSRYCHPIQLLDVLGTFASNNKVPEMVATELKLDITKRFKKEKGPGAS